MEKKFSFFLFFFFIFTIVIVFSDENEIDEILKKAIYYEKNGDIKNAIKFYKSYLAKNKDDEKIHLKLARLIPEFSEKTVEYRKFLTNFPASRYRFIARLELAQMYLLKDEYDNALSEFIKLKELSKGNEYYYIASYNIASLLLKKDKFDDALKELNEIIKDDENKVNRAEGYYLIGLIYTKKKMYKDAEENFLFIIHNFTASNITPLVLYELINIYLLQNRMDLVEKYSIILNRYFPDSPQAVLVKNKLRDEQLNKIIDEQYFNIVKEKNENENNRIKNDFKLSLVENDFHDLKFYYLQLAYLSNEENAKALLLNYQKKVKEEFFIAKTKSNESNKIFYRIVIGPFFNYKNAIEKKEELKKNEIESVVMELIPRYE